MKRYIVIDTQDSDRPSVALIGHRSEVAILDGDFAIIAQGNFLDQLILDTLRYINKEGINP